MKKKGKSADLISNNMWKKIWSLQGKIFQAQDKKEAVKTFFNEIGKIIPYNSAVYFPVDIPTQVPCPTDHIAFNLPDYAEAGEKYGKFYYALDPLKDLSLPSNINKPAKTTDFVPPNKITEGEYYNDFLKPLGIAYNLGCQVGFNGRSVGALGFHRGLDDKDFTERDKIILAHLAPPLAYALYNLDFTGQMSNTLRKIKKRAGDVTGAEQVAAWFFNGNFEVMSKSVEAQKLMEEWVYDKHKNHVDIEAFPKPIIDILRKITQQNPARNDEKSANKLLLEINGKNYLFTAMLMTQNKKKACARAILLTAESMSKREKTFDLYPSFNFTPREEEISALLVQGFKNGEVAEQLCISVNTVKGHLKSIFEKTRVDNRTALISLLFMSSRAK
ncbi:hypothetical protein MNBD_NITROSPINAE01-1913 [hydrothermal vent metagenome]|uniref:HTH luxR-type domain-containing protein n=1 Tax=hydrothermal vent metagenome TaxID=652676 RepID=A0A3B1CN82_9ZZZZ